MRIGCGDSAAIRRPSAVGSRSRIARFRSLASPSGSSPASSPGSPLTSGSRTRMYNPRAFGNLQFNWFRIVGRMKEGVRTEQAHSVLQTAFTNFRSEYAPREFGPERPPDRLKDFWRRRSTSGRRSNGPSPAAPRVRTAAVDSRLHCVTAAADRRLQRREPVPRSNVGPRTGDGAAAVDRRRAGAGSSSSCWSRARSLRGGVVSACSLPRRGAGSPHMLASPDDPVRLDLRLIGGCCVRRSARLCSRPRCSAGARPSRLGVSAAAALKTGSRSGHAPA